MVVVKPGATLEWITPNALEVIERAGRTCYKSEKKIESGSAAKFVKMIHQRGHESVVEHAVASFRIVCDRGVSHEIVRHRLASYSQESTRYCNYSKENFGNEISVIEPPGMNDIQRAIWWAGAAAAEKHYFSMLKSGCNPQIARSVLPTCLKTELVMTANFREWAHFIKLRTSSAAHPQIVEIAKTIQGILIYEYPQIFDESES